LSSMSLGDVKVTPDEQKFQQQLETLNAHPERWFILEVWVMTRTDDILQAKLAMEDGDKLSLFGFGDVSTDTARALLAARESEAE